MGVRMKLSNARLKHLNDLALRIRAEREGSDQQRQRAYANYRHEKDSLKRLTSASLEARHAQASIVRAADIELARAERRCEESAGRLNAANTLLERCHEFIATNNIKLGA